MTSSLHSWILAAGFTLIAACGGGGGDRAAGVDEGPPQPGGEVTPPPPELPSASPAPYAEAENLFVFITDVSLPDDGRAVVRFQLSDETNTAITDLSAADVRFIMAKLRPGALGNLTGHWQSYINRIEQPGVGTGTRARLQATTESNGEFTNNGDGTYVYRFATALDSLPGEIVAQAAEEELDLTLEPALTHRVAIQFANGGDTANPVYDWVPATGATDGLFSRDIAATPNCNRCHDQLALHGGGRTEMEYCVTCHNPGSTDANSGNSLDMEVMIHKIHMGAGLPSVQAGGSYLVYGFRDSKHDYSNLHYPQDIRRCVNCHAGTATGAERTDLVLTAQGDNWNEYPDRSACGSCHDTLDFAGHAGGQQDDSACAGCHGTGGVAGTVAESHRIAFEETRKAFAAEVLHVDNSAPGQQPTVTFRISNPLTGTDYDLFNDPVWTHASSSLNIRVAWDTGDYHNTGNQSDGASSIAAAALASASANGDGSYRVTLPIALPDGGNAPGVPARGSGVAVIEGHPAMDYNDDGSAETVPVGDAHAFFSIDEPDSVPVPRRRSVTVEQCLACHGSLVLHGDNRADNIDSCVTCHNPRNTDRGVREMAATPPTDGKQEESLDFKTMVHGIHAAAIRQEPLQIVGFRGFTTHVFDSERVHYPGRIGNCRACHTETGFTLPLSDTVLATTVNTGEFRRDPGDDTVVSPTAAVCASCHDDRVARAHMTSNGGSFATSQAALDAGEVVEQCALCHGPGQLADIAEMHPVRPLP